jgi:DNA (cytosine-5)-methyltransferase 1
VCSKWSKGTGGPAGDECQNLVAAHAIPFDTTQICSYKNYSNPRAGDPCHPLAASAHVPAVAFTQNSRDEVRQIAGDGTIAGALSAESGTHQTNYIAFANRTRDGVKVPEVMKGGLTPALTNPGHGGRSDAVNVAVGMGVRRLTPRECERLQGFPDDYTLIEWRNKAAADGPRYKALGNSMAVPVMRWIGERIALADSMERQRQ